MKWKMRRINFVWHLPMPTHLVGRIDLFTSQWIEHVLNSSLPIHAFCLRQSKSELLKLITEEIDLNHSYCEPTKTNRIVANKQRRNRQVGCEDEEGRWKLAANRQQYAENKFRFINLNVPKINWKFCFFFFFSRQRVANDSEYQTSHRRWRQKISRIYLCTHYRCGCVYSRTTAMATRKSTKQ